MCGCFVSILTLIIKKQFACNFLLCKKCFVDKLLMSVIISYSLRLLTVKVQYLVFLRQNLHLVVGPYCGKSSSVRYQSNFPTAISYNCGPKYTVSCRLIQKVHHMNDVTSTAGCCCALLYIIHFNHYYFVYAYLIAEFLHTHFYARHLKIVL